MGIQAKRIGVFVAKAAAATLVLLAVIAAMFNLRLGWGAQVMDCVDSPLYVVRLVTPKSVRRGDYVVFVAWPGQRLMGPFFDGHLVIKKVGAVAGDTIKVEDRKLYINGKYFGPLDIADHAASYLGVPVDSFNRTQTVPQGSVFMVGTKPHTFDGRYWGFVPLYDVVGTMYPVL